MKDKLDIVSMVVTIVSGALAILNQQFPLFWSYDRAPEILICVCVVGLLYLGLSLSGLLDKFRSHSRSFNKKKIGLAILVVAPIGGLLFWNHFLRLSPADEKTLNTDLQLARSYASLGADYRDKAISEYQLAMQIAPWRGSIKKELADLEGEKSK